MKSGIYHIINLVNNKVYVGGSCNLNERKNLHNSLLRRKKHHSIYLQRAYNKYGKSNFKFIVIEYTDADEGILLSREQYWIDYYNSSNKLFGYNMQPIAGRTIRIHNYYHSEETKEKIRKANVGQKRTKETITKIVETRRKNNSYFHTDETKKQISDSLKGHVTSEKTRELIRQTKIGDKNPSKRIDVRKKMSDAHKGYVMPESQKRKISMSMMGKNKKK